ncbi:unnamed protein product, partial [Symbiodinium sp. KB8]
GSWSDGQWAQGWDSWAPQGSNDWWSQSGWDSWAWGGSGEAQVSQADTKPSTASAKAGQGKVEQPDTQETKGKGKPKEEVATEKGKGAGAAKGKASKPDARFGLTTKEGVQNLFGAALRGKKKPSTETAEPEVANSTASGADVEEAYDDEDDHMEDGQQEQEESATDDEDDQEDEGDDEEEQEAHEEGDLEEVLPLRVTCPRHLQIARRLPLPQVHLAPVSTVVSAEYDAFPNVGRTGRVKILPSLHWEKRTDKVAEQMNKDERKRQFAALDRRFKETSTLPPGLLEQYQAAFGSSEKKFELL